jgi:type III pantothenate kinase
MLLAIDIGNTNIKLGIYQGQQLLIDWRVVTERFKLADEYAVLVRNLLEMSGLELSHVTGCAISCVVPPLTGQFRELAQRYLHVEPVMVSPALYTGLRYDVDPPHEMGSDRIANSLAAYRRYGGPVIAIALGTATAFDVITADGVYVGGAIAPGIGISAEALFRTAARLYQVELKRPPRAIAKNTVHFMQSGLIIGYAGLVEGLVRRMQHELEQECTVVATGGLADVIAGETDAIHVVEPYLTLEGLRLIYLMNDPNQRDHARKQEPSNQ